MTFLMAQCRQLLTWAVEALMPLGPLPAHPLLPHRDEERDRLYNIYGA